MDVITKNISLLPQFIRHKCKQSQHSQTSFIATLMTTLLLSSSIFVMYKLFALSQLLVSITGGRASLCIPAVYIEGGLCSQINPPSSTHLVYFIEQV